jgi:hypothetical protein
MLRPSTLVLSLTLIAAAAPAAHAAVCIQLDTAHDNLTEQERSGTMTMLASALQQQGQQVVAEGCQETWVVYHVRLGYSVNVFVQSPRGYRQATARAIEEVPAVYSQIVHSMLTGQPINAVNGTVDRTNVTATQQAPNRVEADSLWYARLGYASITGPIVNGGPSFGFGYRYELDNIGVDFSFNIVVANHEDNTMMTTSGGVSGSWAKLMGSYFLNPTGNGSTYLSAGASWGGAFVSDTTRSYSGSGLQGELSGGYEFLRASTIRMFAQADATLPIYMSSGTGFAGAVTTTDRVWTPTFSLSVGIGWGRSIVRLHMVP